jgi:hypothetical protein
MICPHGDIEFQFRFFRTLTETVRSSGNGFGGHRNSGFGREGNGRSLSLRLSEASQPDGP